MRRFFTSLKGKIVGSTEESEAVGTESVENSENPGESGEVSMTSVSLVEESAVVSAAGVNEVSEMEQMQADAEEEIVPVATSAVESCGDPPPPLFIDSEVKKSMPDAMSVPPDVGCEIETDALGKPMATAPTHAADVHPGGDLARINIADQLSSPAIAVATTTGIASTVTAVTGIEINTSSESSDTSSWEPKAKDVKMALTDNNAVVTKKDPGERSISKPEVIHPLQNCWGIWCFMQNRDSDWHENVRHISNFSSVEDFWSLFNHIQTVDNLPIGCDYYIFKANIQPMWEDRANINGGRWLLKIPQSHPNFVQLWIETLLLLVGEAFEAESESICGAVAQVRRGINKISIWTRDAVDRNACMRIGYKWKKCLKVAAPIHYEAHMEVNRKGARRSKSVYSIN